MPHFSGTFATKLPGTDTSIFAIMSALSHEHNAINLSQGFPDFDVSDKLIALVQEQMHKGLNQYAPMPGILLLREQIALKTEKLYGAVYHPEKEINITAGATQALFSIITAIIHEGDEAIILEPAYDSYAPTVKLCGGIPVHVPLELPDYHVNWELVKKVINQKTRMIVINTPHNPTGSILSDDDLKTLAKLTKNTDIIILSDEVYEHLIFDNIRHESACRYPELVERSFVVSSFGKTFHATGWKMGYVLAPENLMKEFRKVHQFTVFACNTPVQYAMAEYLKDDANYLHLNQFYQDKRDLFLKLIQGSRFEIIPCRGTYFQVLSYNRISDEKEIDFAKRLTIEHKIASIPISPFYQKAINNKNLRFCFAKKDETLMKAAEILVKI